MRSIWDENVKSKCFTTTQLLKLSYTNTGMDETWLVRSEGAVD